MLQNTLAPRQAMRKTWKNEKVQMGEDKVDATAGGKKEIYIYMYTCFFKSEEE